MVPWVVNYRPHLRQAHKLRASSASLPLFHLLHLPHLLSSSFIFRIFFQVPYPATPLFATLTKTAGVYTNNSHSGTHVSPVFNPIPYPQRPIPFCFTFLRTPFALFCTFLRFAESQLLYFQAVPHSPSKNEAFAPTASASPHSQCGRLPRITERRSRTTSHEASHGAARLCRGHESPVTSPLVAAFPAECYDLVFHDPC
jgi:hypothetical protein